MIAEKGAGARKGVDGSIIGNQSSIGRIDEEERNEKWQEKLHRQVQGKFEFV